MSQGAIQKIKVAPFYLGHGVVMSMTVLLARYYIFAEDSSKWSCRRSWSWPSKEGHQGKYTVSSHVDCFAKG